MFSPCASNWRGIGVSLPPMLSIARCSLNEPLRGTSLFYFILFYFILFYFILFYFILFYFILFYFILFYFILFYFILFYLFLKNSTVTDGYRLKNGRNISAERAQQLPACIGRVYPLLGHIASDGVSEAHRRYPRFVWFFNFFFLLDPPNNIRV
jgi:hypothetical protein